MLPDHHDLLSNASLISFDTDTPLAATPDVPSKTSPRTGVSRNAIPQPTYVPPDPTKKSHARRQPHGHVARPRNAFILFRCDFVRQKKIPPDVENDHRNISRIAGSVWREMTAEDKAPWVKMAETEKEVHMKLNPGYRYSPVGSTTALKKRKRGDIPDAESVVLARKSGVRTRRRSSSCPPVSDSVAPASMVDLLVEALDASTVPLNLADETKMTPLDITNPFKESFDILSLGRSSSCPPGSPLAHVSFSATMHENTISSFLGTRDDLARRPSRATMYQSFPPIAETDDQLPFVSSLANAPKISPVWPVLDRGAYALDPPGDAPGWDCAPSAPWEWTTWNDVEKKLQGFDHFVRVQSFTPRPISLMLSFTLGHRTQLYPNPSIYPPRIWERPRNALAYRCVLPDVHRPLWRIPHIWVCVCIYFQIFPVRLGLAVSLPSRSFDAG